MRGRSLSLHPFGIWIAAVAFGSLTMASVVGLLVWDVFPQAFPSRAHVLLGATPLGLIAISSLIYQATRRPRPLEIVKAVVLAAAFVFWAANQLLPDTSHALLLNDLAIALFVLDVFLTIVGWPPPLPRQRFNETQPASEAYPRPASKNSTSAAYAADAEHSEIFPADSEH